MEQPTVSLQADFLDVRHAYAEVAVSKRMAVLCCLMSVFTLAQAASLMQKISIMGPVWGVSNAVFLLASLVSCLGLWWLRASGKKGALRNRAFGMAQALPLLCAIIAGLLCLGMVAVLVVVVFSNDMVHAGISQLGAQLSGTYFRFITSVLQGLGTAGMAFIAALCALVFLLLLLMALRYALLTGFVGKLRKTEVSGVPLRLRGGYVVAASYALGVACFALGCWVAFSNPLPGVCCALMGGCMFTSGLVVCAAARETDFLYTYYDKLNRALKKQTAMAHTEPKPPLAIPAPAETTPADTTQEAAPASEAPAVIPMPPAPDASAPEASAPDASAPDASAPEASPATASAPAQAPGAEGPKDLAE